MAVVVFVIVNVFVIVIVNVDYRWCCALPLGGITFLEGGNGHVHAVGVHQGFLVFGLGLVAAEDEEGVACGCVLHGYAGLQATFVGQGGGKGPCRSIAGIG